MSLKLSDTRVYEPQIRARLGTTAHLDHSSGPLSQGVAPKKGVKGEEGAEEEEDDILLQGEG